MLFLRKESLYKVTMDSANENTVQSFSWLCNDCPRKCNITRTPTSATGFCRSSSVLHIARAAPHFGEEPCISGTRGSGAIFFTGCNLRCIFCQNYEISRSEGTLQNVSIPKLREIMLKLRDDGVHNINLVTPSHYTRQIAEALSGIDLGIPVVWNSSGYESIDSLKMLDGLVQIYMPDYKYASAEAARKYSLAADYPQVAAEAIREMFRQRGAFRLDSDGILQSGLLIRHLILPGTEKNMENSMDVIDFVADNFPKDSVLFSLMSQYTPMPASSAFPELTERVTEETNELLIHYMRVRHLENGYWQDASSATTEMIPTFDGTGIQ